MIIHWILLITLGQIVLYLFADWAKLNYVRTILFLAILAGHIFIFPTFFYPEPDPQGLNCGLPILGISCAFWIVGGGITILTHFIYYLIKTNYQSYIHSK